MQHQLNWAHVELPKSGFSLRVYEYDADLPSDTVLQKCVVPFPVATPIAFQYRPFA